MPVSPAAWNMPFANGGCGGCSSRAGQPMPNQAWPPTRKDKGSNSANPCNQQRQPTHCRSGWVHYRMQNVKRENQGQRIVPLQNLQPWGKQSLFFQERTQQRVGMAGNRSQCRKPALVATHLPATGVGTRRPTSATMRLLLVHQNFPGQFRDLGPALCDRGHELKAIGSSQRPSDPRIEVLRYEHSLGERTGMHPHSLEVDEWIQPKRTGGPLGDEPKATGLGPGCDVGPPRLG